MAINNSAQKFIARNRAPRVQIEYDVEIYGSEKKIELPFVMAVLADLAGKPREELPPVTDRKFLDIDIDNFNERMKAIAPRVAFAVPNTLTGEGQLMVDITLENMDDFSPAQIARKVDALNQLLEARTQLANLQTYMDGKAGAENLINKLLQELSYPKEMLIPGHQIFDPEEQFYLSRLHDGRYVLHYTDRSYYVFDEFDDHGVAPLLFMETPYRQRIAFGRENGRLVRVASSSGHHLLLHRTMTQAGERLSHIELVKGGRPGNLVEYRYDDNGQLTGVVNRAGVTVRQFAYENGLMTEHRNATGFTCTYRWEEIEGFPRVVEHSTSDGEDYRFHYDFAGGQTVVTGRPEQKWQWWFDEETYVTAHRTPGGGMYRFTYNENHFPVAVELPGERRVTLEYDTLSRVVKETDAAGRVTQTQWNGSFAEITRRALDDDHVWKADYNEHGQVIRETDPEGRVTRYGYDEQGLAVSRTDARGGEVALAHDARGQLRRYTDCSGCARVMNTMKTAT